MGWLFLEEKNHQIHADFSIKSMAIGSNCLEETILKPKIYGKWVSELQAAMGSTKRAPQHVDPKKAWRHLPLVSLHTFSLPCLSRFISLTSSISFYLLDLLLRSPSSSSLPLTCSRWCDGEEAATTHRFSIMQGPSIGVCLCMCVLTASHMCMH